MATQAVNVSDNILSICVFCGSASGDDPAFAAAARRTGALIGAAGARLVFGGGGHGLMGEVARATRAAGGSILGIMPDFLRRYEMPPEWQQELTLTVDLQQRKTQLLDESDAFIVLPGGPGTMDEFFEVVTSASLNVLPKPILVVDVKGYFAPLAALMEHMNRHGFVRPDVFNRYALVATPDEAMDTIAAALGD